MDLLSQPSGCSSPTEMSECSIVLKDDESSRESEEQCQSCSMMRQNTMQSMLSLSIIRQRVTELENSDRNKQQLEKINRDQATLIDEFRSDLKTANADRSKVLLDNEQLKITNSDLRRQLDEVLEASRRQKEGVRKARICEQRYAETLAALKSEHDSREQLVIKYSKMANYAEAYEIQVKKMESELERLRESSSSNEANMALYTQHCPSILRLLLELGDAAEKNERMTPSQKKRLAAYTNNFGLRQALMRKGRLSKPKSVSISTISTFGDSEDDEMAESLESMMAEDENKKEQDINKDPAPTRKSRVSAVKETEVEALRQQASMVTVSSKQLKVIDQSKMAEDKKKKAQDTKKDPSPTRKSRVSAVKETEVGALQQQASMDTVSSKQLEDQSKMAEDKKEKEHNIKDPFPTQKLRVRAVKETEVGALSQQASMGTASSKQLKANLSTESVNHPQSNDGALKEKRKKSDQVKQKSVQLSRNPKRGRRKAHEDSEAKPVSDSVVVIDREDATKREENVSEEQKAAEVVQKEDTTEKSPEEDATSFECHCSSGLTLWRRFSDVEPLLQMPSRPVALPSTETALAQSPMDETSSYRENVNEWLGLALSPSVSMDSVNSSNAANTSFRDRMLSESADIEESPTTSGVNPIASALSTNRLSRRARTLSTSDQPNANEQMRSRSVSITVVSGRDNARALSEEGSREPLRDDDELKRPGSRQQTTGNRTTLARSLLFRSPQRLWSCEQARRSIARRSIQRRTISCSANLIPPLDPEEALPVEVTKIGPLSPRKRPPPEKLFPPVPVSLPETKESAAPSEVDRTHETMEQKTSPTTVESASCGDNKKEVETAIGNEKSSSSDMEVSCSVAQENSQDAETPSDEVNNRPKRIARVAERSVDEEVSIIAREDEARGEMGRKVDVNENSSKATLKQCNKTPDDSLQESGKKNEELPKPREETRRDMQKRVNKASKDQSHQSEDIRKYLQKQPEKASEDQLKLPEKASEHQLKVPEKTSKDMAKKSEKTKKDLAIETDDHQEDQSKQSEKTHKNASKHLEETSKDILGKSEKASENVPKQLLEIGKDQSKQRKMAGKEVPYQRGKTSKVISELPRKTRKDVLNQSEKIPKDSSKQPENMQKDVPNKLKKIQKDLSKQSESSQEDLPNQMKKTPQDMPNQSKKTRKGSSSDIQKSENVTEQSAEITKTSSQGKEPRVRRASNKLAARSTVQSPRTPRSQMTRLETCDEEPFVDTNADKKKMGISGEKEISEETSDRVPELGERKIAGTKTLDDKESDVSSKHSEQVETETSSSESNAGEGCSKSVEKEAVPKRTDVKTDLKEVAPVLTKSRTRTRTTRKKEEIVPTEKGEVSCETRVREVNCAAMSVSCSTPRATVAVESSSDNGQPRDSTLPIAADNSDSDDEGGCLQIVDKDVSETAVVDKESDKGDDGTVNASGIVEGTSKEATDCPIPCVSDSDSDGDGYGLMIADELEETVEPPQTHSEEEIANVRPERIAHKPANDPFSTRSFAGTVTPIERPQAPVSRVANKHVVRGAASNSGQMLKRVRKLLPMSMIARKTGTSKAIPSPQTDPTRSQPPSQVAASRKRKTIELIGVVDKPIKMPRVGPIGNGGTRKSSSAILLSQPVTGRKLPQQSRVSRSNMEIAQSAAMALLDEAVVCADNLSVLVGKFCQPPVNALDSTAVVTCMLKLLRGMEVGNMWSSMLAASRHGVVEQVASLKERNLFEFINQICAEPAWNDVCYKLFIQLASSLQRTELASVSQHGRDFRCLLIAGRIAAEEGKEDEVRQVLCDVIRNSVLSNSSEWVVPMLCYALNITPHLINELLIGKEDSLLATRTLIAVHVGARDDYYSLFPKMLSLAYNVNEESQQCVRRMDSDNFNEMMRIVEEVVVSSQNTLNLNTFKMEGEFERGMSECVAIYASASVRIFPEKDLHIHQLCAQALDTIADHPALTVSPVESSSGDMFADTSRRMSVVDNASWRASNSLMLSCRLLIARVQRGSFDEQYVVSFKCFRKQIAQFKRLFDAQFNKDSGDKSVRLYRFALDDWQRVLSPLIKPSTKH